jgi:hypothetical protein
MNEDSKDATCMHACMHYIHTYCLHACMAWHGIQTCVDPPTHPLKICIKYYIYVCVCIYICVYNMISIMYKNEVQGQRQWQLTVSFQSLLFETVVYIYIYIYLP